MSTLVHAALTVRKTARRAFGLALAAMLLALPVLGVFGPDPRGVSAVGVEHAAVALAWLVLFATRALTRSRIDPEASELAGRDAALLELELGLLLLAAVHSAVQLTGGISGPAYPALYVLVAFSASFARKPMGTALVAIAIVTELCVWRLAEPSVPFRDVALHATFVMFFGVLNVLFTRAELARVRERSRKERAEEKARTEEEAKLYRLVGAPSAATTESVESGERGNEKLVRGSVDEVRDSLFHTLELLKRTLDLHSCVLLLGDDTGRLRLVESVSDGEVAAGPFDAGAGAVGAVATRGLVMSLENLKPGYKGLCYYETPSEVRCFLGVPVVEEGRLRGALCADRLEDRPFGMREEEILRGAVRQVLRAIQNERVFVQLERSKREQAILFRASTQLGGALTEDQVIEAGLAAASGIARYDFAAITSFDATKRSHRVLAAVGEGSEVVQGLSFKDNHSLTAMAVKNKHYLPYRGEYDPRQQVLYTQKTPLPDARSVLVLPLVVREDAIGTLALATRRSDAFGGSIRPTLQVLANQLATSLSNARAVKRLEEMATTDGLTGCLNKRAFLEDLDSKMRSAERFKKKLSLLVTDIDHFKSVNDTYGHATGDVVIKELGAILTRMKRETDRVARFGGEEFCVLCEETDTEGAVLLAERVREELMGTTFSTELGKLRVTCSVGVATYPRDASNSAGLFEITDKALYAAKHAGRNRVCTTRDL